MMRTKILVSTARMTLSDVLLYPPFQFLESSRCGRPFREQRPVYVLRRKPARAPDDDLIAVFVPFQNRPRAYAELAANIDRN